MAPARLWFLVETLIELQQRWRQAGSRLIVVAGDPVAGAAALGGPLGSTNGGVEPGCGALCPRAGPSGGRALQADGRKVLVDWDQLLVAPELLKTGGGDPYRVYGPFLRNWRGQVERSEPEHR